MICQTNPIECEDPNYIRLITSQIIFSVMGRIIDLYIDRENETVLVYEGTDEQEKQINKLQLHHLQRMIFLKNEMYKDYLFMNGLYVNTSDAPIKRMEPVRLMLA